MGRIAIFPGSFDPFTRGHQAIVEQALRLFDSVVVAIGYNPTKQGLLTVEARKKLIESTYENEPRVSVDIYTTLTGDYCVARGAVAMVRGVRSTIDFEMERGLDAANRRLFPELTTVVLFTPADVADISSSGVRELLAFGRGVEAFLPQGININDYITK